MKKTNSLFGKDAELKRLVIAFEVSAKSNNLIDAWLVHIIKMQSHVSETMIIRVKTNRKDLKSLQW